MSAPIPIGGHDLRRELAVWRPSRTVDAGGGGPRMLEELGTVWAKVSQSTAEEQAIASSSGATHTHNVHMRPDVDVKRGDELRGGGEIFKVILTLQPSTPTYLKAQCERRQTEPASG